MIYIKKVRPGWYTVRFFSGYREAGHEVSDYDRIPEAFRISSFGKAGDLPISGIMEIMQKIIKQFF